MRKENQMRKRAAGPRRTSSLFTMGDMGGGQGSEWRRRRGGNRATAATTPRVTADVR